MAAFSGKYNYTVDPKGRVMVPAPFREIIAANYSPKLYITNSAFETCLHLYPLEEWNLLQERVRGLPQMDDSVGFFMKRVIASALEVEMDKQGRVLVPVTHREDSGMGSDVVIVGQIDKIAIWDRARWDEATDITRVDVQAFKRALTDFGL